MTQEHWNKQKKAQKLIKLLSILTDLQKANFSTLLERMQPISEPTLAGYISALEKNDQIESFGNPEDRRETWYRIKAQNREAIEAQIGSYEAIQFIESLNNPLYSINKKGSTTVSLFAQWDNLKDKDREKLQKNFEKIVGYLTTVFRVSSLGDKFAIVVTKSKEAPKID